MDTEIIRCEKCSKKNDCSQYCYSRIGSNIVSFVNNISKIETRIGDTDTVMDRPYVVCGAYLENTFVDNVGHVLKPCDVITSTSCEKLTGVDGIKPAECVKNYLELNGYSQEEIDKALSDFNIANSNKRMVKIVSVGSNINISYKPGDVSIKSYKSRISKLRFEVLEDGTSHGFIIADNTKGFGTGKKIQLDFNLYGKDWSVPDIEAGLNTSQLAYELIDMNSLGIIKPIEFEIGRATLAIDNCNMYSITDGVVIVIGKWNNDKMEISKNAKNYTTGKSLVEISKYFEFISRHKKYIMPYKTTEALRVKL